MDRTCQQLIQQNMYELIYNSGHFLSQMGLWQDCIDSPNNNSYFMADFINNRTGSNPELFLGMCLPSICDKDYIKEFMNEGLAQFQQTISQFIGAPLAVGTIHLNPQDQVFAYTGWFYLTIAIIAILSFMSIFSIFWVQKNKKQKRTDLDKVIQCFSLKESMKTFAYKSNYLNIFSGIKALGMFWVVFGHIFFIRFRYNINITGQPLQFESFFYLFVTGGFLAVDVFLFIGGFLVAYSFIREKSKSIKKYPMAILHRVLRFWPSYVVAILLYYSVLIHTNRGPLWRLNLTMGLMPDCEGAWKSLIFIDNLVDNGTKMCMQWGWYMQTDMQIFVFSLLFIFLYMKKRMVGYISLIVMIFVGLFFNFYGVFIRDIHQMTHLKDYIKFPEYFYNVYIKPWVRCPPYILGLIFGLLHMQYLEVKKKLKEDPQNYLYSKNFYVKLQRNMMKNRIWSSLSQLFGVILMLLTLIVPRDLQVGNVWPEWVHAFYISFQKITFTLGVYLVALPSLLQVPNMTFFLLDTKFLNFASKISFWVYLFHFLVIYFVDFGEKVDFYYSLQTILPLYFGVVAVSLFGGFLGTVLVQVPFSKLEKMLFSVLLKKNEQLVGSPSDSDPTNRRTQLVHQVDPSTSGGELKDLLLQSCSKQDRNINRSICQ